jgi:hypothetical protein
LLRIEGDESIIHRWKSSTDREELKKRNNLLLLDEYVAFSVTEISKFLQGAKEGFSSDQWLPANKQNKNGVLTVNLLNGLLICFRMIVNEKGLKTQPYYKGKLASIEKFPFSDYRSSRYTVLGKALYEKLFK